MSEFVTIFLSEPRAFALARIGNLTADCAHPVRSRRIIRVDDGVEHVIRMRRGKVLGKLALDVTGVLMQMMKNRAVEDERLERGWPLPQYLPKSLPKIRPDCLCAQTKIVGFFQKNPKQLRPMAAHRAERRSCLPCWSYRQKRRSARCAAMGRNCFGFF